MIVKSVELSNYRNINFQTISFVDGFNILYGNNAQGKTNILEAIYLCATTKSHRGSKANELIKMGEAEAHIKIWIVRDGIDHKIDYHIKKDNKKKWIAIDEIPVKKYSEIFSLMNVISFSPEDLSIVKNGPAERRHFMDMELCQLDKVYLFHLSNYNKALTQRNALLRQMNREQGYMDMLTVWDEQLISNGERIIEIRQKFIEELGKIANTIHQRLTNNEECLSILYQPQTKKDELKKALIEKRSEDIRTRMTLSGPHRDDIKFYIQRADEQPQNVRKYGSQGQQRTVALSVKLAEIEFVKQTIKDTPIILLDDVLSELDRKRQKQLLDGIENMQTILTCTGLEEFVDRQKKDNRILYVENGTVTEGPKQRPETEEEKNE